MTIPYWIALNFTRLLRFFVWRVRFTGQENLPKTGGYVVACNHRCVIDPVWLAHGISRQVFFMAKAEVFKVPGLGWLVRRVGVFPVERGTGDMSAVEHAINKLRQGGLLGIFPEGTRSHTQQLLKFKSGMAHIAKTAEVGVIPCAICFQGRMGWMKRVEVKYGPPISYRELFGEEQSAAALKRATKLVQANINQLLGQEVAVQ